MLIVAEMLGVMLTFSGELSPATQSEEFPILRAVNAFSKLSNCFRKASVGFRASIFESSL
ncbi:hypothetical protein AS026_33860 [Rhizobium altiplani]|uniref:Uncharacterized protein n=1 Tax=Rhizobium altiplani TaxID=1864509 RepID=A0A109JX64_9HYPH|nr:hypothetical protein AS026_33860 [Rhizobium altiplani]